MKLDKKNFTKYLLENFIFENNPDIAIAVSGGPDSIALLFLANDVITKMNGKLISLIVDHNLRKESSKEAINVANYLSKKKINSKILTVKKNKIINKSMNEARVNRYNLLTNYCKKNNILHLFVGHNKDDNIETFINRKIAGSDFDGLQSIKKFNIINQICIIRPLLNYSKKQIISFNNYNNYNYVEDLSNQNYKYSRPIIRRFLKETSFLIKKEINKDYLLIQKNSKLYNQMIFEQLIITVIEAKKNSIKIDFFKFIKLDFLISEKIIKKIYYYFNNSNIYLKSKKIQILRDQLINKNFKIFNLKSMIVKKDNNCLIFSKKID